ncbi:hypothetical protein D3C80_1149080 [compost metagenome]
MHLSALDCNEGNAIRPVGNDTIEGVRQGRGIEVGHFHDTDLGAFRAGPRNCGMHLVANPDHEGIVVIRQHENEGIGPSFGQIGRRHIAHVAKTGDRLLDALAGNMPHTRPTIENAIDRR